MLSSCHTSLTLYWRSTAAKWYHHIMPVSTTLLLRSPKNVILKHLPTFIADTQEAQRTNESYKYNLVIIKRKFPYSCSRVSGAVRSFFCRRSHCQLLLFTRDITATAPVAFRQNLVPAADDVALLYLLYVIVCCRMKINLILNCKSQAIKNQFIRDDKIKHNTEE